MPKFYVKKTIAINAPLEKVHAAVRDFRQWPAWSPWLISEPDCTLKYAEDGRSYSWDGEIVGSGETVIIGENAPTSIDYRIVFRKPWKSVASVRFEMAERDGYVQTTWSMESSIPIFIFFMKNRMAAWIGGDYQRGIEMLKDYVETGSVPSKLEFIGRQAFSGFHYVGLKANCSSDHIGERMCESVNKVKDWLKQNNVPATGDAFPIYHKFDKLKKITIFTVDFPVQSVPGNIPADLLSGEIPNGKVYSVKHTGPYRHLGNPWSACMAHASAKTFRQNKKIPCFEVYANEPDSTPENDLITTVHFPAK